MVVIAATTRVLTMYGIGRTAIDSSASISSAIRIEPISAVRRQPAWAAKPIAAIIGANSRVLAYDEMNPVRDPIPTRSSEA